MMIWLYRRVRVALEGWVFVLPLAGATVLSALVGWWGVTGVGLVLTLGVALFFRDPERIIPQIPETIVSPADGRVMEIVPENTQTRRISIFFVAVGCAYQPCPIRRGGTERCLYARAIPGSLPSGSITGE
jgi:phosphatidylserine decarboxylase